MSGVRPSGPRVRPTTVKAAIVPADAREVVFNRDSESNPALARDYFHAAAKHRTCRLAKPDTCEHERPDRSLADDVALSEYRATPAKVRR